MQLKRTKLLAVGALAALTLTIVACSSSMTIESTPGAFGRAGGVSPVGSTGVTQPESPPRCPADPPKVGSNCSGFASICTYGPDTRESCVESYDCYGSEWEDATRACAVQCPKTFAEITPGTACGDSTMACSYDEGTCGCVGGAGADGGPLPDASTSADSGTDGGDGGFSSKPLYPGVWKCVPPPGDVACPSARPRVLDACVRRVTCDYGTCELGRPLSYSCEGVWQKSYDGPSCDE